MQNIIVTMILIIIGITFIAAAIFAVRYYTNVITPVNLVEPRPGIECATMVGGDGVAIDCWKVDN